ncbi:MAG TPA: hypothetical protein VGB17_12555 [Pyrinomonadaceae bacterium]|jgi:hypothetical protein
MNQSTVKPVPDGSVPAQKKKDVDAGQMKVIQKSAFVCSGNKLSDPSASLMFFHPAPTRRTGDTA